LEGNNRGDGPGFQPSSIGHSLTQADGLGWDYGAPLALEYKALRYEALGCHVFDLRV